jgi:ankyrin repeat protein
VRWTDPDGKEWSLHEACYAGKLEAVRALLAAGADPNASAGDGDSQQWISAAGDRPRPLHCVAIAWEHTYDHVEIVKALRAFGAIVEETVLDDYWIETTLSDAAIEVGIALGIEERALRALRADHGVVDGLYKRTGEIS